MPKRGWLFALVVVGALALPSVVYAAAGAFSAGGSTTALRVSQSGSGRAIKSVSNRGQALWAARTNRDGKTPAIYGTTASNDGGARAIYGLAPKAGGRTFGVYGQTNGGGTNASGVFGTASHASGATNGVWGRATSPNGTGVYGQAPDGTGGVFEGAFGGIGSGLVGLAGVAGDPGDGSYGLWSLSDALFDGHLLTSGKNVAGLCTILLDESSRTCLYDEPFAAGVTPIVVVTPNQPGTPAHWVSTSSQSSFTISLDTGTAAEDLIFYYMAMGVDTSLSGAGVASGPASTMQAFLSR